MRRGGARRGGPRARLGEARRGEGEAGRGEARRSSSEARRRSREARRSGAQAMRGEAAARRRASEARRVEAKRAAWPGRGSSASRGPTGPPTVRPPVARRPRVDKHLGQNCPKEASNPGKAGTAAVQISHLALGPRLGSGFPSAFRVCPLHGASNPDQRDPTWFAALVPGQKLRHFSDIAS